jgi:hypothetical protein
MDCKIVKSIWASIVVVCLTTTFSKPVFSDETVFSSSQATSDSQIRLIDSFDKNGQEKPHNELGGGYEISNLQANRTKTPYTFGNSLEIELRLNRGQEAFWKTNLNGLDVSQAQALSFWIKARPEVAEGVTLVLTDDAKAKCEFPLARLSRPHEFGWQEIVISKEKLKALDLNRLNELILRFKAQENMEAVVWIDNLAFVGEAHFSFLSLKDNLLGFPQGLLNSDRRKSLKKSDYYLLQEMAKDTWGFFRDMVDKNTHLPIDNVRLSPDLDSSRRIGDYTSPTTMGLYLASCAAASKLGFLKEHEAIGRIKECIHTARELKRWKGFLLNYYNTTSLRPTHELVSTVDNAWWAAGLMIVAQAFPEEVGPDAKQFLKEMNFKELYDESVGQFRLGYDVEAGAFRKEHYGLLVSEARITSFIAIAKGDVPADQWFRIYRTLPADWTWQNQKPRGRDMALMEVPFFEGYYLYDNKQPIVPSWGGSLFEFLMPTLVVDENRWAPKSLGLNNRTAVDIHREYALDKKKYSVWGMSPCTVPNTKGDNYGEYGVQQIGVKGYEDKGVITPHVSFLALAVRPEDAAQNIRHLLEQFDDYGPYGFYDSIHAPSRTVAYTYLALDQAMTFLAIANFLKEGYIQKMFESYPGMQTMLETLKQESFYNGKTA